jgi:Phospholipid methyltransferase
MKLLQHQHFHLLSLTGLLVLLYFGVQYDVETLQGNLWGIDTSVWFGLSLLSPIVHQIYVLVCWRLELYYKSISKTFGEKGFGYYKFGFAILILSRLATITLLAISNAKTLEMNTVLSYTIVLLLAIPTIYLFYSVKKYFGMDRAFGLDHFNPEKVKVMPFVKRGIFKYTNNGMYVFGFFILWIPGFIFLSKAALLVALFNHLYIWAHYYFTELPDIKNIYAKKNN